MENGSKMRLTIITGMSGAGKTVAVQCLEDMGYFCIDNLPPMLLLKFIEMIDQSQNKMDKIAVVMDLRGRAFFRHLSKALDEIAKKDWIIQKILFLEASDEVLIRRYKETRRNHPLAPHGRISEGIKRERALLSEIKGQAQIILDSSGLKPVQLKNKIQEHFSASNDDTFSVHIFSFGFKYGSPIDADLLFDVRFLPNPYYVEKLRILTGLDESVSSYVLKCTIEGVKEDVTEIVLNLKGIAAKLYSDGPKTVRVEAVGPCEVTADSIKQGDEIEILNPEWHIAMWKQPFYLQDLAFPQQQIL